MVDLGRLQSIHWHVEALLKKARARAAVDALFCASDSVNWRSLHVIDVLYCLSYEQESYYFLVEIKGAGDCPELYAFMHKGLTENPLVQNVLGDTPIYLHFEW